MCIRDRFTDEPNVQRELVKLSNSMLQRNNIVSDFAQIFRAAFNDSPGFRSQQFAQCGLCAFRCV